MRAEFSAASAPAIFFNKSHSGSRVLARLAEAGGIFMGSQLNESYDALPLVSLVEHLVVKYYPDYSVLWDDSTQDDALVDLLQTVFREHLGPLRPDLETRWGWKLCETAYILPVLDFIFPCAKYVHLIRDGRDVAFSDHTPPNTPFWKKIYFNTDAIESWRGMGLRRRHYEKRSEVYNAQQWVNSVTIGRAFGGMMRQRYREIRYEDICLRFDQTVVPLLHWLDAPRTEEAVKAFRPQIKTGRIGKFTREPWWKRRRVLRIVEPTLYSFGYG